MCKYRFFYLFFFFSPGKFSSFCFHSVLLSWLFTTDRRLWTCNRIPKKPWEKFKSGLWYSEPEMTAASGRTPQAEGPGFFCLPHSHIAGLANGSAFRLVREMKKLKTTSSTSPSYRPPVPRFQLLYPRHQTDPLILLQPLKSLPLCFPSNG